MLAQFATIVKTIFAEFSGNLPKGVDMFLTNVYNGHMDDPVAARIGERVREWRESRGWSQGKLAFVSGVQSSHISLIERGLRRPKYDTLSKLAEGFRKSYAELVSGIPGFPQSEEEAKSGGPVADRELSELQMNALAIKKLDPEEYELLLRQLAERRAFIERRYKEERERRSRAKRNKLATDTEPEPGDSERADPPR